MAASPSPVRSTRKSHRPKHSRGFPTQQHGLGTALAAHHAHGPALDNLALRVDAGPGAIAQAVLRTNCARRRMNLSSLSSLSFSIPTLDPSSATPIRSGRRVWMSYRRFGSATLEAGGDRALHFSTVERERADQGPHVVEVFIRRFSVPGQHKTSASGRMCRHFRSSLRRPRSPWRRFSTRSRSARFLWSDGRSPLFRRAPRAPREFGGAQLAVGLGVPVRAAPARPT